MWFFLFIFCPMGHAQQSDEDKFVVVLDAGHGGHDPGNLGNGYFEKNIALNIVLKIGRALEKLPDVKVIYTRKNDTFIDLYVRGEIANRANADLFVSVHCDSHTSNAHGAGTFVLGLHANKQNFEIAKKENSVIYLEENYQDRYADYDINSPESVIGLTIMQEEFLDQSIALAKMIQDNFTGQLKRTDRKVKQAGFIVLHQTFMPSVLVETGFLTNKQEGAYLDSKRGQDEMAKAIAEAISKYKKSVPYNSSNIAMGTLPSAPEPPGVNENIDVAVAQNTVEQVVAEKNTIDKENPPTQIEKNTPEKKEVPVESPSDEKMASITETGPVESEQVILPKANENEDNKENEVIKPDEITKPGDETDLVFKVQIFASSKDLPDSPDFYNGLNRISKEPFKNMYRYLYGSTNSISEAKMLKANADLKGYPTSYIVGYRNGVRISAKEVAKYLSK